MIIPFMARWDILVLCTFELEGFIPRIVKYILQARKLFVGNIRMHKLTVKLRVVYYIL